MLSDHSFKICLKFGLLTILVNLSFFLNAQELKPEISFARDTIKIADPVDLTMTFRHPPTMDILFPDSLYNFFPFELVDRQFFTTYSAGGVSVDSVIYTLGTFEMQDTQTISLPVFILAKGDCTTVFSNEASVYLDYVIKQLPDSVKLRSNTDYALVKNRTNSFFYYAGLAILIILIIITEVFFGKRIRAKLQIYVLNKRHRKFTSTYEILISKALKTFDEHAIEACVSNWKEYLSKLDKIPVYAYSTKEIIKLYMLEQTGMSLRNLDKCIYGNFERRKVDKFGVPVYEVHTGDGKLIDSSILETLLRDLFQFSESRLEMNLKYLRTPSKTSSENDVKRSLTQNT